MAKYTLLKKEGNARRGTFETVHGTVQTPAFMNVATAAAIKGGLSTEDLEHIGCQVMLCNTYHLHLRPGDKLVADMGGLHKFTKWDGPILTDSGGFQVFSLAKLRNIKEEGVTFRSHLDGSKHLFTPEKVVSIQRNLNSDIMMVLDECVPAGADHTYYYPTPVEPGEKTEILCDPITLGTVKLADGTPVYQVLEVFAEAIQAEPVGAVQEAWNVTVSDTRITPIL